jgi:hypothetical protein
MKKNLRADPKYEKKKYGLDKALIQKGSFAGVHTILFPMCHLVLARPSPLLQGFKHTRAKSIPGATFARVHEFNIAISSDIQPLHKSAGMSHLAIGCGFGKKTIRLAVPWAPLLQFS